MNIYNPNYYSEFLNIELEKKKNILKKIIKANQKFLNNYTNLFTELKKHLNTKDVLELEKVISKIDDCFLEIYNLHNLINSEYSSIENDLKIEYYAFLNKFVKEINLGNINLFRIELQNLLRKDKRIKRQKEREEKEEKEKLKQSEKVRKENIERQNKEDEIKKQQQRVEAERKRAEFIERKEQELRRLQEQRLEEERKLREEEKRKQNQIIKDQIEIKRLLKQFCDWEDFARINKTGYPDISKNTIILSNKGDKIFLDAPSIYFEETKFNRNLETKPQKLLFCQDVYQFYDDGKLFCHNHITIEAQIDSIYELYLSENNEIINFIIKFEGKELKIKWNGFDFGKKYKSHSTTAGEEINQFPFYSMTGYGYILDSTNYFENNVGNFIFDPLINKTIFSTIIKNNPENKNFLLSFIYLIVFTNKKIKYTIC